MGIHAGGYPDDFVLIGGGDPDRLVVAAGIAQHGNDLVEAHEILHSGGLPIYGGGGRR